jgi:hypothetical protein
MAGKKPAKPVAGQSKVQQILDPSIYGTLFKVFGTKNSPSVCSYCSRQSVRGMIRIRGEESFCSIRCAEQSFKMVQTDSGEEKDER